MMMLLYELSEKFAEKKNLTFALIANARQIRISCALASKSIDSMSLWMRANGLEDEEKKKCKT